MDDAELARRAILNFGEMLLRSGARPSGPKQKCAAPMRPARGRCCCRQPVV